LSIALLLLRHFIVVSEPFPTPIDHCRRRLPGLLAKYLNNHDSVQIDPVDNSLRFVSIDDPQFMAMASDRGRRPRVRKGQQFTALKLPSKTPASILVVDENGGRLDLGMQPDQGFD
jgi:hypothetical protein